MRSSRVRLVAMALCAIVGFGVLAQEPELGFVSGLVYDADGGGVENALVLILPADDEGGDEEFSEGEGLVDTDLTDAGGAYDLAVLPGAYQILVEADGYVPTVFEVEVFYGLTFAEPIILARAASISGFVRTSDGSTPVAQVAVTATASSGDAFLEVTDSAGEFLFLGLPSGEFTLQAVTAEEATSAVGPIAVAIGESVEGIELILSEAVSGEPPHPDGGSMSGVVRFAESRDPVAGAVILVTAEEGEAIDRDFDPTGADGSFVATGLAAGIYQVSAGLEGYATFFLEGVSVEAGVETGGLELLMLAPSGEIRGTVTTSGGAAIGGALVLAIGEGWSQGTLSADDGSFVLEGLPEGTAELSAIAEGYAIGEVEGVMVASGDQAPDVSFVLDLAAED